MNGSSGPLPSPQAVLYVHPSDELYGSDAMLLQLIRGLDRARFRPIVVLPRDLPYSGLLSRELALLGVPTYKLDLAVIRRRYASPRGLALFIVRLVRSTVQLRRLIRAEGVAIVHSNTIVVLPGALAARWAARPHIWQVHELLDGGVTVRRGVGYLLSSLSSFVVANSQATRVSLFGDSNAAGRIRTILNGVRLPDRDETARARLRAQWRVSPDTVVVGALGRLSPRKGIRQLLLAAREVVAADPRVHFVLAGDIVPGQETFLAELEALIQEGGVDSRVHFIGFQSNSAAFLEAIDVLAMPVVRPESFGLAAAEAMAHARAVIASDCGGLTELVDGAGLLIPPDSVPALVRAILELTRDGGQRRRLGDAGRRRIASLYSVDAYCRQFADLYDSLIRECCRTVS